MTIKRIWQTEDGGIFDTEEAARRHEFKQELIQGIYAASSKANTGAIADRLINNYRIEEIKKLNAGPPPLPILPLGPHGVPIPSNCELDPSSGFVRRKSDGAIMLWNGVCFERDSQHVIPD